MSIVNELSAKVLSGKSLSYDEAKELLNIEGNEVYDLLFFAHKIKLKFIKKEAELCAIIPGKVGRCPENCKFCAQSVHYNTNVKLKKIDRKKIIQKAIEVEAQGARRYSIVNSGYSPTASEFEEVLDIYSEIKAKTSLKLCASLGVIDEERAKKLKKAGVTRYHHNVETSRKFYPKICTTHSYDKRLNTINAAKRAGMEICCGGIISLGEIEEDRLDMAFEIRELNPDSVPINILTPIPGTPLENQKIISPMEILKTIAIFRFIMPDVSIRIAGGRITGLKDLQPLLFLAGADAMITGDYLTTHGRKILDDVEMIKHLYQL